MGLGMIIQDLKQIGSDIDAGYPITREMFNRLIVAMDSMSIEEFRTMTEAVQGTKEGRSGYYHFVLAVNRWKGAQQSRFPLPESLLFY